MGQNKSQILLLCPNIQHYYNIYFVKNVLQVLTYVFQTWVPTLIPLKWLVALFKSNFLKWKELKFWIKEYILESSY